MKRLQSIKIAINERRNEIIITMVTFCLCLWLFPLVTDDYAYFMSSLAAKQFCDFAYFDVHFQGFIGIREGYKLLYHLVPQVNWHFFFMLIYDILSLYLIMRVLRIVILRNVNNQHLILALQVLIAIFYADSLISVSHTRVSIIFCGAAMIYLGFTKQLSRWRFVMYGLLFITGMLLRSESAMGILAITVPGILLYTMDVRWLVRRIWLPVLAMGVFLIVFAIDLRTTDIYVRKVEPEIEYKMMARRVVGLDRMRTAKDSVKYEAAMNGMWFDTREMTPEWMRGMILPGSDMSEGHMVEVLRHIGSFYSYYVFLAAAVITLFVLALVLTVAGSRLRILKMVLLQLYTLAVIYALDYNGFLVAHRHFMPLSLIALMITAFYLADTPILKSNSKGFVIGTLILLYGAMGMTLVHYSRESRLLDGQVKAMEKVMERFEQQYTGKVVAVTIDDRFLFDRHFSLWNETYAKNTYIMFDWFTFPLTPRYVDYIGSQCGCDANDPVAFFRWLSSHNALYLGDRDRCRLVRRYMEAVHDADIKFETVAGINETGGITNSETQNDVISTVHVTEH